MNLFQRILFYAGGFAAGLIILFFFLGGKRASCDYSPNARVLKNVRIKKRIVTAAAQLQLQTQQLDTAAITQLLHDGDVDFDKSDTKSDPCKTYWVDGEVQSKKIGLSITNCDTIATIQSVTFF